MSQALASNYNFKINDVTNTNEVAQSSIANPLDDLWLGEPIAPMLSAVFEPERFWMAITQVSIKRKVGNILIPDTAVSDQEFTHGLAIVVKVGPTVYKGRRFEDIGLTPEDAFKPGDVVYFNASAPRRFWVDGRLFLFIPDDAVMGRADRNELHRIKFTI